MRRLYHEDAYLTEFRAVVTASRQADDGYWVALDQTAFYPGGGGQPPDTGEIAGMEVSALREDEHGLVWHCLGGPIGSGEVAARVDRTRRFDLMQQHTGQHLLSAAFLRVAGAETVGFHLTLENLQIDLDRAVAPEALAAAEKEANGVVWKTARWSAGSWPPVKPAGSPGVNLPRAKDLSAWSQWRITMHRRAAVPMCGIPGRSA